MNLGAGENQEKTKIIVEKKLPTEFEQSHEMWIYSFSWHLIRMVERILIHNVL